MSANNNDVDWICERKFGARAASERRGTAPDNFRGVASGCSLFRGKNVRESAVGTRKVSAVRSLEVVASRR